MITQTILNVIGKTLISIIGLIPPLSASLMGNINTVIASLGDLALWCSKVGVIIPWGTAFNAAQLFFAFWLAAASVYMLRFLISLVTGGGGR